MGHQQLPRTSSTSKHPPPTISQQHTMSSAQQNPPSTPTNPKVFSQFNKNPALYRSPTDAMVSPCTKQLGGSSNLSKRAVMAAGRKNLQSEFSAMDKENSQ